MTGVFCGQFRLLHTSDAALFFSAVDFFNVLSLLSV